MFEVKLIDVYDVNYHVPIVDDASNVKEDNRFCSTLYNEIQHVIKMRGYIFFIINIIITSPTAMLIYLCQYNYEHLYL